jgi:signal transduction histidine kinase
MDWLDRLLRSDGLVPHGYCLIWDPVLLTVQVGADALIALSYFSIPAVLAIIALRRRDLGLRRPLWLFAAFILTCGITHVFEIATLWEPIYGPQALAKIVNAAVSIFTAVALWPLLPKVLAVPSHAALQEAEQRALAANDDLEHKIELRTAELVATNSDLKDANAVKARFLAHMSHELRTPLNAVIGFSELVLQEPFGPVAPKYAEYLRDINLSGQHLLSLVNEILDYAKIEAGHVETATEPVAVEALIRSVLTMLGPAATHAGIELTHDQREPLLVLGNEGQLRQALINVVGNAIKFSPRGGVVTIGAMLNDCGAIEITTTDQGCGIAEKDVQRVLEPFVQINSQRGGTGLGLPISKRLIETMQGKFELRSVEHVGTTVSILLPEAHQTAALQLQQVAGLRAG